MVAINEHKSVGFSQSSATAVPLPEESYYETTEPLVQPIEGSVRVNTSSDGPILQLPQSGTVYASPDDVFLKWLFDHKARTIIPLKYAWRGMEWSNQDNKWVPISDALGMQCRIMNETGIVWAASLLESYFNPVFLATNLSVRNYNFRMRVASRFIMMTLCERYKEFGLLQSNIDRVAEEIESKISALLAGAINDGYRRFLTTQTHVQENKTYGVMAPSGGAIQSIFSRSPAVGRQEGY